MIQDVPAAQWTGPAQGILFFRLPFGEIMDYKFTYNRLFNVLFHIGVIFNVLLVIWVFLVFFEVL